MNYAKILYSNGFIFLITVRRENLYYIEPFIDTESVAKVRDFQKWHFKLGLLNKADLNKLKSKNMVGNLNFNNFEFLKDFEICF